MARFRRLRWIAIAAIVATVLGGLVVGAEAWADRGTARCTTATTADTARQDWRAGAFRVAGCRAWRKMHRHEKTWRHELL